MYGTLADGVLEVQPYCKEYGMLDDVLDILTPMLAEHLVAEAAPPSACVAEGLRRLGLAGARLASSSVMQAVRAQALLRAAAAASLKNPQQQQQSQQQQQQQALRGVDLAACPRSPGGGRSSPSERLSTGRRASSPPGPLPPIPELPLLELPEPPHEPMDDQGHVYTAASMPLPASLSPSDFVSSPDSRTPGASPSAAECPTPPAKAPKHRGGRAWRALSFSFSSPRSAVSDSGEGLGAAAASLWKQLDSAHPPATPPRGSKNLRGSDLGWRPRSFPSAPKPPLIGGTARRVARGAGSSAKVAATPHTAGTAGSSACGSACISSSGGGSSVATTCSGCAVELLGEGGGVPQSPRSLANAVAAATSRLLTKVLGSSRRRREEQQAQLQGQGQGQPEEPAAELPAATLPVCELVNDRASPLNAPPHAAAAAAAAAGLAAADSPVSAACGEAKAEAEADVDVPVRDLLLQLLLLPGRHPLCAQAAADVSTACAALGIGHQVSELLNAHEDDPGLAMRLAHPVYKRAVGTARAVKHQAMRQAVQEALRRFVNPYRGSVDGLLHDVMALAVSYSSPPSEAV